MQTDAIFDENLEIADDGRNDWMERHGDEEAGWVANGEHIQRSRLRIDTRKWMASKLAPKKYGDKLDLNNTHEMGDGMKAFFQRIYEKGGKLHVPKPD